jgi:uncharacterized protein (DUF2267 family)
MPMRYAHAGEDFDRFVADARDALGLVTSHQTYTAVQAVLWAFRRRLGVRDAIAFANLLPPVVSAVYLQEYAPDQVPVPFGGPDDWLRDVRAVRSEHNFAPADAVPQVAAALRRHVDTRALDAFLAALPAGAAAFWSGDRRSPR